MKQTTKALSLGLVAFVYLVFGNGFVHADTIYVSDGYNNTTGHNTIEKFDSSGNRSTFVNASFGLNYPEGLALDGSGNLYVSSGGGGSDTIYKFDSSGNGTLFANTGLSYARGLAFDGSGNLYAANWGNNTIEKFDPSGHGSLFANSGLDHPVGLAFDSSGNLYVSNLHSNTIEKFDSSGHGSLFADANSGLREPSGLAFDSSGNLYVSNHDPQNGNSMILKFDSSGHGSLFANSAYSWGLAFDSSGNLYAANPTDNTIEKFFPYGLGSLFASSGLFDPEFIAVQVPEPAAWAMMLVGIGALLGSRRLHRRSS